MCGAPQLFHRLRVHGLFGVDYPNPLTRLRLDPLTHARLGLTRGVDQIVCVCSVWVPCVTLPSGGGASVGPSPLCGSPVWVPCAGPLCGSPVWGPLCGSPVWVSCVGPSSPCVPCGIYSRDVSRSFTRSRSQITCVYLYMCILFRLDTKDAPQLFFVSVSTDQLNYVSCWTHSLMRDSGECEVTAKDIYISIYLEKTTILTPTG